jgi:hypothetical protein
VAASYRFNEYSQKFPYSKTSVSLILGSINAALIPFEGGLFSKLSFVLPTFGSIIIGAVVCGFGTSIYSAADQNSADMTIRKALFSIMVNNRI